ncbi:hypothetical protein [Bacillus massiliigorillae]|uniref:hypothetical protein n=1 Tax=Bacillus massiliigorillae TaxID=1243664 RepID=UPI0003A29B5F|nr:hypothetical protein [Bacillus massiliigorillae]
MKEFKVLKFLDRFRSLLERFEVNYDALRLILQMKLIMDARRVPLAISDYRKKDGNDTDKNQFIRSLWIYILFGLFLTVFIFIEANFLYQMTIFFGILMFIVMTSLISDFSTVLLDTKDKNIILSKPINERTLGFAKVIHISIYMFYLTMSVGGPGLIAGLIKHGFVFFIIMLIDLLLINLLVIVLTALLYLVILRFFDGEKLKSIINYVQILLSIGLAVGYQLVGRVFNIVNFEIVFEPSWWHYFMIPVWYAAPFEIVLKGEVTPDLVSFCILGVIIPLVAILLYIKLMPMFERNLLKLSQVSTQNKISHNRLMKIWSRLLCREREERIFFHFANELMKSEREFKLKVFPALGLSIIFPFIFIFNSISSDGLQNISPGTFYFIYFCGLMIPNLVYILQFSEKYKAAWIYRSVPIKDANCVNKGVLKAALVRYLLPLFIIQSICFVYLFGMNILIDLIVVILSIALFTMFSAKILVKALPFSLAFENAKADTVKMFTAMFILGGLALVHFVIQLLGIYILVGYIIILVVLNYFVWK